MADSSNAGTDAGYRPIAQFQPFEWVRGEGLNLSQQRLADFLNGARDVVHGAQLLSEFLSWDQERCETASSTAGPAPVLDARHRGALQRFLFASLGLLGAEIERQCEGLDEERAHRVSVHPRCGCCG